MWVTCHPIARIHLTYYLYTKFNNFRFSHFSDMTGAPKVCNGSHDLTASVFFVNDDEND